MDTHFVRRFGLMLVAILVRAVIFSAGPSAADERGLPGWEPLRQLAREHLGDGRSERGPISRSQVESLLNAFESAGWSVPERAELLERVLPDDHVLVRELHTPQGRRFLSSLSGERSLFDRLDRISREAGGEQLIHDLLRLPDGARFARGKPTRGAPDLIDFLPKTASGKRRQVRDFDQPTGRFYTPESLLQELEKRHAKSQRSAGKK